MINKYEISKELDYLLASYAFRNKPQIQRLLTYLVNHVFDDLESAYDQRAIAVESLGRNEDFDPAENPVVRIEIGRLRKLLDSFYSEETERALMISIPLGQYRPVIVSQEKYRSEKFIPELVLAPAKPESLSLLLQFETNGDESSELYLLRHQIRIGLTVRIGALQGVRLIVALPDEDGNVNSAVDFIVRISVGTSASNYQLFYSVLTKTSKAVVLRENLELPNDYTNQNLSVLINNWETDLLDREVGILWAEWVHIRSIIDTNQSTKVKALVAYQRYLINDTKDNLEFAFVTLSEVQRNYPEDAVMNTALAELYYRVVIHGSDVTPNPIQDGLLQVRVALRSNAACMKLHLLLAFMMFFSKEYQMAKVELKLCSDVSLSTYSFQFHLMVLNCLMTGLEKGLDQLQSLCNQAGVYPQLYLVMLYLRSILVKNYELAENWRDALDKESALPMIHSCINHMVLPSSWSFDDGREQLKHDVVQHFSQVS